MKQYIEQDNITIDQIAKELNIHKVSVWRFAKKLGITWFHKPRKKKTIVDIDRIINLYDLGHTTSEIGKIMNISNIMVCRRLNEYYGRKLHPSLHNTICKHCKTSFDQTVSKLRYNRKYTLVCLDCYRKSRKEITKRVKKEVIDGYGGRCNCCGEDTFEFLTIDHINGRKSSHNGFNKHGYKITGQQLYYYLKRNNFPKEEYQILCINCNFAKGVYGECPHKSKTKS